MPAPVRDGPGRRSFARGEKGAFLGTHDAGRGYPRIHMCHSRASFKRSVVFKLLIFNLGNHCICFLSIAVKDFDAVQRLAQIGLGLSQRTLLEHRISDNED